jgi:hypothetical protein
MHVATHSKDSRALHITELSEMFMPFLLKKEEWGSTWEPKVATAGATIQIEFEEAGVVPVATPLEAHW